jgi:membrane glycosyltransferase
MLSIPLASLSSYESIGLGLLKRKWFVIPEEIHTPPVANKAKRIYATLKKDKKSNGVLDLIANNYLLEIHTYMLKTNGPIPEFSKSIQNEALIKLHNYINYGKIPQFTPDEEFSILYDADVLHEANLLHYLYK